MKNKDGFNSIYKHKNTPALVHMKNLGMGEKKIRHADGTEEKISNSDFAKLYSFHGATEKRIGNISKRCKNRITKTKRIA